MIDKKDRLIENLNQLYNSYKLKKAMEEFRNECLINEETMSKFYIKQGYLISFSTNVILIFKLNSNYENCDINSLNEIYKKLYKEILVVNEKCRYF